MVMAMVAAWFRRVVQGRLLQRRGNVFIDNGIWSAASVLHGPGDLARPEDDIERAVLVRVARDGVLQELGRGDLAGRA